MFHCKRASTEKAQHRWHWISLRMLTQGRLVPRQPWAIKRTTPTALHYEGIYIAKYIHGDIGTKFITLRRYNIHHVWYIHWNTGIASYWSSQWNHAFSKKAQHLWRWISLRMLTQGRLVPRQPWAIKRTTPTALHYEGIYNVKHMHRKIIIIHTMLRAGNIHNGKYNH